MKVMVAMISVFTLLPSLASADDRVSGRGASSALSVTTLDRQISICGSTFAGIATYVHSTGHDSLASYRSVLTDKLAWQSDAVFYSVVRVRGAPRAVLARRWTYDGEEFVLRLASPSLSVTLTGVKSIRTMPRSDLGVTLGDPISKVIASFGPGKPRTACGVTVIAYAWGVDYGDAYVSYGYDADNRVVRIESGFGGGGIRHLWE